MNDAHGRPQSIVVFGATSDIARGVLRALVGRRTRTVVLAGRHPESYDPLIAELRAAGAETVAAARFDAREPAKHARLVDEVFEVCGDVDLVLIAFGLLGDQAEAEQDPAVAAEVAQVNYVGAVWVGTAVAKGLRQQGHGNLVVLSSVAAERPRRSNFVYGSSKAGLDAFFLGLGDSLRGSGARVMVVRPGFVRTKMTAHMKPLPFATTPEAVAAAIAAGLARRDDVVWVPAKLRWVMSGLRHLPRPLFRRIAT